MLMYLLGGILYTSKGQGKQNLFIDLLQHLVSAGKESACSVEDLGLIPGLRRSPGEGNGNPLQYSCLEDSMERGAWQTTVHGIARSWTQLSN